MYANSISPALVLYILDVYPKMMHTTSVNVNLVLKIKKNNDNLMIGRIYIVNKFDLNWKSKTIFSCVKPWVRPNMTGLIA